VKEYEGVEVKNILNLISIKWPEMAPFPTG
jgi:hypothetical protein